MSEELKQQAREFLKAHNWDDEGDFVAEELVQFASQVCEQREKEARQQAIADLKPIIEVGQAMSNVFFNTAQLKEYPADYREKANALRIKWDEARRSLTPPPALTLDVNRCAVCGWTLSETAEKGCVRGNCSLRPRPANLYDPERAAAERLVPPALTKEK